MFADARRVTPVTSPVEIPACYQKDDDKLRIYDGSAWEEVSGSLGGAAISDTPTGNYTSSGGVTYDYWEFDASSRCGLAQASQTCFVVGGAGRFTNNPSVAYGGGGGAGEVSRPTSDAATYPCLVVGAGAAERDAQGTSSRVDELFAFGGGLGGAYDTENVGSYYKGVSGGSGGGGGGTPTPARLTLLVLVSQVREMTAVTACRHQLVKFRAAVVEPVLLGLRFWYNWRRGRCRCRKLIHKRRRHIWRRRWRFWEHTWCGRRWWRRRGCGNDRRKWHPEYRRRWQRRSQLFRHNCVRRHRRQR